MNTSVYILLKWKNMFTLFLCVKKKEREVMQSIWVSVSKLQTVVFSVKFVYAVWCITP